MGFIDFTGKRKQTQKRGIKKNREATAWEHEMMLQKGNKRGIEDANVVMEINYVQGSIMRNMIYVITLRNLFCMWMEKQLIRKENSID